MDEFDSVLLVSLSLTLEY